MDSFSLYFRLKITFFNENQERRKQMKVFKDNDALFFKYKDAKTGEVTPADCDNMGNNFFDSCIGGMTAGAGIFVAHLVIKVCRKIGDKIRSKKN